MQNTSHAVMAQRQEPKDSLDDFPTPPWATRALMEHVIPWDAYSREMNCLEPACGAGHMAKVLKEYFHLVHATDVHPYGYGAVDNFLQANHDSGSFDWVVTNPPFRLAENFIAEALGIARVGVAMLVRTVFIESVGRYERLFLPNPPSIFAQFTERVPMVRGRLDRKASTATGYAWIVWLKNPQKAFPRMAWVPPCRKDLEKDGDYEAPSPHVNVRVTAGKKISNAADQPELFGT